MADRRDTRKRLEEVAASTGLVVCTWSPGDGLTRYRFMHDTEISLSYDGAQHPLYTALGLKEAWTWWRGYRAAYGLNI